MKKKAKVKVRKRTLAGRLRELAAEATRLELLTRDNGVIRAVEREVARERERMGKENFELRERIDHLEDEVKMQLAELRQYKIGDFKTMLALVRANQNGLISKEIRDALIAVGWQDLDLWYVRGDGAVARNDGSVAIGPIAKANGELA